jgi:hypothetical protein
MTLPWPLVFAALYAGKAMYDKQETIRKIVIETPLADIPGLEHISRRNAGRIPVGQSTSNR